MAAAAGAELVDVVDDDDRVIATVPRAVMRAQRLMHRAVFIAVVHPEDGRVLVHRRSESKDVWPGWWDIAVGGVVGAGESYDEAARRELAEEVGLVGVDPQFLGGGRYVDESVALLGRCYRVMSAGPFTFADGEVVEAAWRSLDEIGRAIRTDRYLPDSIELLQPVLEGTVRP